MVELELERTFLAASLPEDILKFPSHIIRDIYIPDGAENACLRLRQKDNTYVITKKQPVDGVDSSRQHEHTIELSEPEFKCLTKCSTKKVSKRRFVADIEGWPAEIDVFLDDLAGLVLIDFEFATDQDMDTFKPPKICLADVSQEQFAAGGTLAGKTYAQIEPILQKYNYQPLTLGE